MPAPTPSVPTKVFSAPEGSVLRFMREHVIWDLEVGSLVRFRGPFTMPSWDGVTENEDDFYVDSTHQRLDIIANEAWGQPEWGWVLAARNSIDLPSVQLFVGRLLKIPRKAWLQTKLYPQAG